MASFFGEIVEPSSRAIFDDLTDEDEKAVQQLRWTWLENDCNVPSEFEVFLIFHGKLSLAFAEAYIISDKSILAAEIQISIEKDQSEDAPCSKILPSLLYFHNNIPVLLISPFIVTDTSYELTKTIEPIVKKSNKVLIFTNESIYNFKTPVMEDLPPAFIKELKSTDNTTELAPELPVPNIISGITAGIASWCEVYGKAAHVLITYSDEEVLDSVTVAPILNVFDKLSYGVKPVQHPRNKKLWYYGHPQTISESSSIYI